MEQNNQISKNIEEINGLINMRNETEALNKVLDNIPTNCKDNELKKKYTEVGLVAFDNINDKDIESTVKDFNNSRANTAMYFVYKGFEDSRLSRSMLIWWKNLYDREDAGLGSIVRAMTAKKAL